MIDLFNGSAKGEDRLRLVIKMMGHPPEDFDSEVVQEIAKDFLNKAEHAAAGRLQAILADYALGVAARKYLKPKYPPPERTR